MKKLMGGLMIAGLVLLGSSLSGVAVAQETQNTYHTGDIDRVVVFTNTSAFRFITGGPSTCSCTYLGNNYMCLKADATTRKTQEGLLLAAKVSDMRVGAVVDAECRVLELFLDP